MISLTFFGGINEIGGNKILLEADDTKLFLDFGMSFRKHGAYFEEYLKPRTANGFGDLIELNLIPKLEGIYREDLLKISKLKIHKKPVIDGLLLSHVHYDHSASISFLDERIPIYCSSITKIIAKALIESAQRSLETEIYNFKRRPLINPREKAIERIFKAIDSEKNFKVGNLDIKPIAVEHSVPGALAYIIYTSEGTILYTGDFRLNGQSELTERMVDIAENKDIDVMLCEGTRIDSKTYDDEKNVKKNSSQVISKTKGLVVADFAYKDITRFNTFYEIAKENDRKIAITFKDAYLYRELKKINLSLPDIKDKNILLYKRKKATGTYRENDYDFWEREFLNYENTVDADYIRRAQNEVIICIGFYDINELIDIKPKKGSVYIHSASEAHNEEQIFDEKRLENWLSHFKLPKYHFHSSGHANGIEIKEIVSKIKPKKLIPIHTEKEKIEIYRKLIMPYVKEFEVPKLRI
ncbi:MAG: MBL fold metallo-hydrolase [Candidatus Thermoplasmatota archaeon]